MLLTRVKRITSSRSVTSFAKVISATTRASFLTTGTSASSVSAIIFSRKAFKPAGGTSQFTGLRSTFMEGDDYLESQYLFFLLTQSLYIPQALIVITNNAIKQ